MLVPIQGWNTIAFQPGKALIVARELLPASPTSHPRIGTAHLSGFVHRMIYREHAEHSKEIDFMLKRLILDLICFRSPGDSVEDKTDKERNYRAPALQRE